MRVWQITKLDGKTYEKFLFESDHFEFEDINCRIYINYGNARTEVKIDGQHEIKID